MGATQNKRAGRCWHSGLKWIPVVCIMVFASGCVLGPKFGTPEVLTAEEWREIGNPQLVGEPQSQTEWWKLLNDPVLDTLVEKAFAENLSLHAAALRIVQARVGRTAIAYTQLPLITGTGSISHSNFSTNVSPEVEVTQRVSRRSGPIIDPIREAVREEIRSNAPSVSIRPSLDVYDAGFDAIWELDLWGKKRQHFRAASAELEAAYAGYDDIMVALSAEVARNYVLLRTTDQRIESMESLLETMNEFTAMTQQRFDQGEALVTDVKLAQLLSGIVKSSLPQLKTARRHLENSLCVLLGMAPQDLSELINGSGEIPSASPLAMVGIPADLLRRRPDVRMAEHLAAAECARIGMAKAKILPSFSIFGAIGLSSSDSDNFFESDSVRSAYGGLASITNLINYPIMVENVRLKDAQFQEALLYYRETVLRANLEVENSLHAYLRAQDEVAILKDNVEAARDTADLTMQAYQGGKVIVSVPLVALSFLASQQDQWLEWQGETITDYIAIYKALGGGWESRVDQELLPEAIAEQMRQQADWWSFTGKHDLTTRQVNTH